MNRKGLFEYKDNKEWVKNRKSKIEEEYESIQKMIATYGDNPRGSSAVQDRLAENLAILLDKKKETLDFAIKLEQDLIDIDHALLKINQPYRNILTDVYIDGKTLVEVANDRHYSYVQICRKHGDALKLYDDIECY